MTPDLSVVIITRNEERNLPGCLESVRFAPEVVVVDAFSSDATCEVARQAGAVVLQRPWDGYAAQRQHGFDSATRSWVLWLDADERVTPELATGIRDSLTEARADGYRIPRRHHFLGDWLRHGGEYPAYQLRLVRREKARLRSSAVHEHIDEARLTVATLESPIDHLSTPNLRLRLAKAFRYGRLAARQRLASPGPGKLALGPLLLAPARRTAFIYLRERAYRDGWRGLLWALSCGLEQAVISTHLIVGALRDGRGKLRPCGPDNLDPGRMAGIDTHRRVGELIDPPGGGLIIDAGAGEGAFTAWLDGQGYKVVALGIEPSQYRFPGAPFLRCDLDQALPLEDGSADGIAAIEVLEHLESPMRFLREAGRCLRPGGWLVTTTPNVLSLSSKLRFVLSGHHLYFGPGDYRQNGHINPLTRFQIECIAKRAGFSVEVATFNVGKLPVPGLRHRFPLRHHRFLTATWGDSLIVRLRKAGAPQAEIHRG